MVRTSSLVSLALSLAGAFVPMTALAATDISQHTFSEALQYVQQTRIMVGDDQGNLRPDDLITKRELITMVTRVAYDDMDLSKCFEWIAPSLPIKYTKLFADVRITDANAESFCGAMVTGLISGRPDGSLQPDDPVSMAEASKIVSRAFGIFKPGRDDPPSMAWYVQYTDPMAAHEALAHTVLGPSQLLTRAEVAVMFYALRDSYAHLTIDPSAAAEIIARVNGIEVVTEPVSYDLETSSESASVTIESQQNASSEASSDSRYYPEETYPSAEPSFAAPVNTPARRDIIEAYYQRQAQEAASSSSSTPAADLR